MSKKIIYIFFIILISISLFFNFLYFKWKFSEKSPIKNNFQTWAIGLNWNNKNNSSKKWPIVKIDIYKIIKSSIEKDKNFDVSKVDKNWLTVELFNNCKKFLTYDWDSEKKKYFNSEFNSSLVDFNSSINCINNKDNVYCTKLSKIKNSNKYTLDDMIIFLYWIYTNNFAYSEYETILKNKEKLNFPELESDIAYSKYYWNLVKWNVNNLSDCVDIIYSNLWNTQLK